MKATVTNFLNGKKVSFWKIFSLIFLWVMALGVTPFSDAQAAVISGDVTCAECEEGFGDIYVFVFDGDDPSSSNYLGGVTISSPGAYTTTDITGVDDVWIFSFWDANGNVILENPFPDSGDFSGESIFNPINLVGGDATDVTIDLIPPNPGPSISGIITCDSCPTEGILFVGVFDSAFPESDVGSAMFASPGDYSVTNVQSSGSVMVAAFWDENSNFERDPNEYSGAYTLAIDLSAGEDVFSIDFDLLEGETPIEGSVEGYVTCYDCPTEGELYVEVYDTAYPGPPVASELLLTPGPYSITDITTYGDITVSAFFDENSNTEQDPDELYGEYEFTIDLSQGDAYTIDFDVTGGASITGDVNCYDCPFPGDLYVYAFEEGSTSGPIAEYSFSYPAPLTVTEPYSYSLTNIHAQGMVSVFAFWDENGNGMSDAEEFVGESSESIDISLGDTDFVNIDLAVGGTGGDTISGYIDCDDCQFPGDLYVFAFEEGMSGPVAEYSFNYPEPLSITEPYPYTLTNIDAQGLVSVSAFWDENGSGTQETEELSGEYGTTVDLSTGDADSINFELMTGGSTVDVTVSGTLTCAECEEYNSFSINVFDGPDPETAQLLGSTWTPDTEFFITISMMDPPFGDPVYIWAYWDTNENGEYDSNDHAGTYLGELILLEDGLVDVNITLEAPEFAIIGAVTNIHQPEDGNPDGIYETFFDILVEGFPGILPDDVDALTITGPSGELTYTLADFQYHGKTDSFSLTLEGQPEIGDYTFDLAAVGGESESATDTQSQNLDIPIPESTMFDPPDGTQLTSMSPTFSWPLVEVTGVQLYYRMVIVNMTGERVYETLFEPDMTDDTVLGEPLDPGQMYMWRVQVADASHNAAIQNVANSDWVTFTAFGDIPDPVTISGYIDCYDCPSEGMLYVGVFDPAFPDTPILIETFPAPGEYSITNISATGPVKVGAFWDANWDGIKDPDELSGEFYSTVDLSYGDAFSIDFELMAGGTGGGGDTISGYINCYDCPSGGTMYVSVFDPGFPDSPIATETFATPGEYSITNISATGPIMVGAFWDADGDGIKDSDEFAGESYFTVDLSYGDAFDVFIDLISSGPTISGYIDCPDCPPTGMLFVYAYDEFNPSNIVAFETFDAPGVYTITSMAGIGEVRVGAFWDENNNYFDDMGEYIGEYPSSVNLSVGNVFDVDFELAIDSGEPEEISLSGTITCSGCVGEGQLRIGVYDANAGPGEGAISGTFLSSTGEFIILDTLPTDSVIINAFWDANGNNMGDEGEYWGSYGTPIDISSGEAIDLDFDLSTPISTPDGATIYGNIGCPDCMEPGDLFVYVFNEYGDPGDPPVGSALISSPGPYSVTTVSGVASVFVKAYWNEDGTGLPPNPYDGGYAGKYFDPVDIPVGEDVTDIDFDLWYLYPEVEGQDVWINGTITCDDCTGMGAYGVDVFDGPDPHTANWIGGTWTMETDYWVYIPGSFAGEQVFVYAFFDANDNYMFDESDLTGAYEYNPMTLNTGDNMGVDVALAAPEFGIAGSVMNMHLPDDSFITYYEVFVYGFPGMLPDDVDSVTITGPSGGEILADFEYSHKHGSFYYVAPGSPESGEYTFTLTSGEGEDAIDATATHTQNEPLTIPIPELSAPAYGTPLTSNFEELSWLPVDLAGVPELTEAYYKVVVEDLTGERVYEIYPELDLLSHWLQGGMLNPGETYNWFVMVFNDSDRFSMQNGARSDYSSFIAFGDIPDPIAIAGPDQTVIVEDDVFLDGSFSEPPSSTFAWTMTAPTGSSSVLVDSDTAEPSFVPDQAGTYGFELSVSTDGLPSLDDTVVTAVAAGTDEAAIVILNQNLNVAFAAYIADPTTENMAEIMVLFSDAFQDDGMDKIAMEADFEEFLPHLVSFTSFVNDIVVVDTSASCILTQVIFMYNEWGEEETEFEAWDMNLIKETDGSWKIYGNQNDYDLWVQTITKNDGSDGISYGIYFGLEDKTGSVTSIAISGPGIGDTITLFDDGMHHDNEPGDGNWGGFINSDTPPTTDDSYVFTINDTETVDAGVSGVMTGEATNGMVSDTMPPSFTWDPAEGAMYYAVEVFNGYDGSHIWGEWGIPTPFIEYMGPPLFMGETYQWRVKSFDEYDNFSESVYFSYIPTTGQEGGDKSISGTVYLTDGTTPVAHVWVNAWSDSMMFGFSAETDENGEYTIRNLLAASDYKVDVWSNNYAGMFYKKADTCTLPPALNDTVNYADCGIAPVCTADWGQATLVDVFANNASGVNILLSAGVTISGTVRDSSGNPVSNVWISTWSENTGGGGGEPTGDDGTYTISGLVEGTDYRVEIWDDQYAQQFYKYDGYEAGDPAPFNNDYSSLTPVGTTMWEQVTLVTTTESAAAQGVNFFVAEGRSISGLVLADGVPVANAWINAWSETQMTGKGEETNQNGEYTINGLMPGDDYKVDIMSCDYTYQIYNNQTDWMMADPVDITTDDAVNINFNLSTGNSISGTVADDNGNGIAGIWVNAHSEDNMFGMGEMTDINGEYVISGLVAAGDYRVDIWADGYVSQFYNGQTDWMQADLVDVTEGSAEGIDFVLTAGLYITGTITLPPGETDFSSVWVNAWSDSAMCGRGEPVFEENVITDLDGNPTNQATYRISGLSAADDYKVDVWSEDYAGQFFNGVSDWMEATNLLLLTEGSQENIDFELTAGTYIEGTVSLPTGYTSYDNIWVNAHSESKGGSGTHVNDDGTYRISGLSAGNYIVELHSENFQNSFYDGQNDWNEADTVVVPADGKSGINFLLSLGTGISGTVVDGSGVGIADIWVDAWSETGSFGGTMTDSDGNFTINGLTDVTEYHVNIWHPDYANQSQTYTTGSGDPALTFTLSEGVSISGRVTNSAGVPIAWVFVNAWSDTLMTGRGEPTNENGEYTIPGLAAASDYRVDIWAEGYGNQFYNTKTFWDEADLVNLTSGAATDIDFVLSSGTSISGTITIPDTGSTDVWVNAFSETKGGMGSPVENWITVTGGREGTYTISGLVPGTDYKVDAGSPDYQHAFYDELVSTGTYDWMLATPLDTTTGDKEGINITLGTGKSISGTVTVEGNLNNLWVNAGSDTVMSWNGTMVEATAVSNVGVYTITGLAPASDYRVDICSMDYGYQVYDGKKNWEDATLVSVSSNDATGINFNLSSGNTISGQITNSDGNGISNAWVNVHSESARFGMGEPTDGNGNYTIRGLDPLITDFVLEVHSPEYGHFMYDDDAENGNNSTTDWMQATRISLAEGSVSNIDMVLTAGGSISGTVIAGGEPVARAWVMAWSNAAMGGNGTETDDEGNYTIKGLPSADDYKVDVWAEGYMRIFYDSETDWMNATPVSILSGDADGIDFDLSSGNSISGTVYRSDGTTSIARIWVNAWSESSGSWGGTETDNDGNYTIEGLSPSNDFVVDVWSEAYAHQFYDQATDWMSAERVDVSTENKTGIDFALGNGYSISGTITLPGDDTDYWRVWVNAWSDTLDAGCGAPVMHDGTFRIPGLVPGEGYKLDVWSELYAHVLYKDDAGPNFTTTDWDQASEISVTSDVANKNMTLSSGASISGTVTLGGEPQQHVWVDAWSTTGTMGGTETDAGGEFTIRGLIEGETYDVSTWSWDYVNDVETNVPAGTTGVALELTTGISISGTLTYSSTGVGNVWVDAWSQGKQTGGGDETDSEGNFIITGLTPNTTYSVMAATGQYGFISADVAVTTEDHTGLVLAMTPGNSITGTVTDLSGGTISTVEVIVSVFDSSGDFYNSTIASSTDGTYELPNLPAGDYKIRASATGADDAWYNGATTIGDATAVASGTTGVVIALSL